MPYSVQIQRKPRHFLKSAPPEVQEPIEEKILELYENPRPQGSKRFGDKRKKRYRIRVGKYRIVYDVRKRELLIVIVGIGPRGDVYKKI